MAEQRSAVLQAVQDWVSEFVVGHNLCPFAGKELRAGRVRFVETPATDIESLLHSLSEELALLVADSSIETTLLVHPHVLKSFAAYNDFLDLADGLIESMALEGVVQVASFHPSYRFAGTLPAAPENLTNRSPSPMLHLLREESIEVAAESHSGIGAIPQRNIEYLNDLMAPR